MINDLTTPIDRRIESIPSPYKAATIEVCDTLETAVIALNQLTDDWTASDAVKVAELILSRVPK